MIFSVLPMSFMPLVPLKEGIVMKYRTITVSDTVFLTKIFSIPEYELYFAENKTSAADWEERIPLYEKTQSLIISDG